MLYGERDPLAEAENRVRNLMWTVSGDYTLDTKLDVASFEKSKYISMYDAVKQGAFARFFDKDAFGLYLVKKIYYGAEEQKLTDLAQLCVDAASFPKIAAERPGIPELRGKAFADLLEHSFDKMNHTLPGRVKLAFLRQSLYGDPGGEKKVREAVKQIRALEAAGETMDIIRTVDLLYNTLIDRGFERRCGDLEKILAVTFEELRDFDWGDFLQEEITGDLLDEYFRRMNQAVTSLSEEQEEKQAEEKNAERKVIRIDEAAAAKMYSYIELNYGKSYLTEQEQKKRNHRLCRGAHADCSLYYTEGILAHPVLSNAQYVNARRHAEKNRAALRNSANLVARSIEQLADELKRCLKHRSEPEVQSAFAGTIVPRRLWRVGRTEDPGRLFEKTLKRSHSDFAVDILMDASGSQRDRQSEVALQAYIIAEAFTRNRIPLQITGFCSFWDYTVLQRYREYDAPRTENRRVLDYVTSANNRDGLAIRAVGDSLLQRPEEGKILIILSDGKPNDIIVNRPNSRNPRPYCGDYGVNDTAFEIRRLRSSGVCVLGIFTGKESELAAEKKIFGRDFTYIRRIDGFSRAAGRYLRRLLEEDSANF